MNLPSPTASRSRGFSLIEVAISAVILALATLSVLSAMVYSSRATRVNSYGIAAKNIAQGYFERMSADNFSSVTAQNYPDIPESAGPGAVWLDRGLGIPCGVRFKFKGFGAATGGSANGLTVPTSVDWDINEWQGDTLYIVGGKGIGQFAPIQSNTAHTLTLSRSFAIVPDATTKYMINNGKTVEITTSWRYKGKAYSQVIKSLAANYRDRLDAPLGF